MTLPYRILAILLAVLAIAGGSFVFGVRYQSGQEAKAQERRWVEQMDRQTEMANESYATGLKLGAKLKKVRTQTIEVIKEVPVYVPSDSCDLPAGWRLLHDAAATGNPPAPVGSDAAPVPAQDAASTVIENYGTCREDQERLRALQEYVAKIRGQADGRAVGGDQGDVRDGGVRDSGRGRGGAPEVPR
jgi:hypothetical protein